MEKTLLILLTAVVCFAQETGARYLIITHDNYYNAVMPLAEWKHRKGLRTKVVKLSQTGSTANEIKTYIQNAYNNWQIQPEFVLLVGAPNYLPFPSVSGTVTDNYYTNMDGDIYNEILSGRLTVHNTYEAQTVVNKILLYEKTPTRDGSNWFLDACLIAREDFDADDSIYWSDIRHVKRLMIDHEYHTIDTLSRSANNDAYDVIDGVNDGRAFVLYRGCGTNNWYYPFDVNPDETENETRLPIVLSITCQTLGTGSAPATAERWFLTGSPSQPRGASGYFATTTSGVNIAHLRSAVCKGFFNALFMDSVRTFGQACEGGRTNVYILHGSGNEYRGYTTIGDPAMNIWTAVPEPLTVLHDSILSIKDESLIVHVQYHTMPVESAIVCVVLDTLVYEYGHTSADGEICFHFETLRAGSMDITVTAHNAVPYLDSISVLDLQIEERELREGECPLDLSISPNPFYQTLDLRLSALGNQTISLQILDISGRIVTTLIRNQSPTSNVHSLSWDGTDKAGQRLASGVYCIHFASSTATKTVPVILLK